ncbi:hypothetical protein Z042_14230 [Chania multitudinisentens RB-25]|uniref:Uncharacterized protein n=1 Tax=Chania multitudinisentens RB-25 TaxID=1441930 RepID=W0LG12_9GAMM|nr:hypothetical protein [Chania multitudinisentens]AHG22808.1 hypothetical protein Z042_14230 [Chania multitudinisentens RB-25]
MKALVWITLVFVVAVAAGVAWYWPVISMELAGSAEYTRHDTQVYEHFTPPLLKAMPRISQDYAFDYTRIDGLGSVIYTVTFRNAPIPDAQAVRGYLAVQGYSRQAGCSTGAECWKGKQIDETVFLNIIPSRREVVVSVDYTPQSR